jgi:hypothetical protein
MNRKTPIMFESNADGGAGGAAAPAAPAEPADRQQHTVPLVELQKERKSRKAVEDELAAAKAQLAAAEQAQLSENEQLKAKLAAAEAEREQLKAAHSVSTKSNLVRAAAKDFADPEDAVAILQSRGALEDIETAEDAERIIKALATDKPHLLRSSTAPGIQPTIEQVLANGLGTDTQSGQQRANGDDGRTLTPEQFRALDRAAMTDLRLNHPKVYERSVAAATKR